MFINLSNHPSDQWSNEQREAALALSHERNQYNDDEDGENEGVFIKDIPFPNIPPTATTDEVADLADQYCRRIKNASVHQLTVVHVMGEMTFTCYLVARLQKAGYQCVAATSERNTIVNPDGSKTIVFRFVQFRNYC